MLESDVSSSTCKQLFADLTYKNNINDRVVENLFIWTDSLHYVYSKKITVYIRHGFTRKMGSSNSNSNPFFSRGCCSASASPHAPQRNWTPSTATCLIRIYSFTFSSAIVDCLYIFWLLLYCLIANYIFKISRLDKGTDIESLARELWYTYAYVH